MPNHVPSTLMNLKEMTDRIPAFKEFGEENAHAAKQQMTRT